MGSFRLLAERADQVCIAREENVQANNLAATSLNYIGEIITYPLH